MRLRHLAAAGLLLLTTACATTASSSPAPAVPVQPRVIEPGAQAWEFGTRPRVVLRQNVQKQAYGVTGDNAPELRADLDRKRPPSPDGRRFDANVRWSLTWSFRFDQSSRACALTDATVELQVLVRLPVLASDAGLSASEHERWQEFAALLETHEAGHVDSYVEGARALQEAYAGVAPGSDCDELRAELKEMGEAQIAAIRAADLAYDRATDHGRLQGATFP